jgi:positive regulator of sigma E activity
MLIFFILITDKTNVQAQDTNTNTTTETEVECGICGSTACTSSLLIYFGLGAIIGWYLGYVKAPKVGRSSPTWFFLGLLTNVLALVVWYVVKDQNYNLYYNKKDKEQDANLVFIDEKHVENDKDTNEKK